MKHTADERLPENIERGARLAEARATARFGSARAAAVANGWAESTYRAHESGNRSIGTDDAEKYGDAFECRGEWIYSGVGPKKAVAGSVSVAPRPNMGRVVTFPSATSGRLMPVYGHARGGEDGFFEMNGQVVDRVPWPPELENVPDAYAVYVVGDSMEPRYFPGEIVYVHPTKPVRKDDFVVVQIEVDERGPPLGFVKRFLRYTSTDLILTQFNPKEEVRFPRAQVRSVHRIIRGGEA